MANMLELGASAEDAEFPTQAFNSAFVDCSLMEVRCGPEASSPESVSTGLDRSFQNSCATRTGADGEESYSTELPCTSETALRPRIRSANRRAEPRPEGRTSVKRTLGRAET